MSTVADWTRAQELVSDGQRLEAIKVLSEANRRERDPAIERLLVQLRHDAWSEVDPDCPPLVWNPRCPDRFEGITGEVPEVEARDLDAESIRAAIQHHGALIVRGLFSHEWCARLREGIDRSWDAIGRYRETKQFDPIWFDPIDTSEYGLTMASRTWVIASGTSYVPDSPRLLFDFIEALEEHHVRRVVGEYFGEAAALSLIKAAQRRLPPHATGGWHQDAAVYGIDARTINFWIPVSRCGDVAPGLAIWPRRLERILATAGSEGVAEFTADDDEVAALVAELPAACPVFDEGDAVIFDQMLLHQTSASPDFTEERYGFECWFFAQSHYPNPKRFIPLVY